MNEQKSNKYIGELSEQSFILECIKNSIQVFKPLCNSKIDYIILLNDKFYKVQCKSFRFLENEQKLIAKISSTSHDYSNHTFKSIPYKKDEIDLFSIYCDYLDKVYIVPVDILEINEQNELQTSFTLRLNKPKNSQIEKIHFEKDFEFLKIIKKILNQEKIFIEPSNSIIKSKNPLSRIGESGYKGVKKCATKNSPKKWESYIRINNKNIYIGRSDDPKELAIKYDKKAIELLGEKAVTNKSLGLL